MGVFGEPLVIALVVALVLSAIGLAVLGYKHLALRLQLRQRIKEGVERSRQTSQAVVKGKTVEQFLPFLPDFEFNPRDARFLGSPIDFVVFDGLTDGDVRRVVFIEAKTGRATLTQRERQVRDAVQAKQVEWQELRG